MTTYMICDYKRGTSATLYVALDTVAPNWELTSTKKIPMTMLVSNVDY